jgi:hypothetical protein
MAAGVQGVDDPSRKRKRTCSNGQPHANSESIRPANGERMPTSKHHVDVNDVPASQSEQPDDNGTINDL